MELGRQPVGNGTRRAMHIDQRVCTPGAREPKVVDALLGGDLWVLQPDWCTLPPAAAAAGTIHVGHALHPNLPRPQLATMLHTTSSGGTIWCDGADNGGPSANASGITPRRRAAAQSPSWPEICTRLVDEARAQFDVAGRSFLDASRKGLCSLAITGLVRGEGRSTVAMCLSLAAARLGGRVALVEGDCLAPDLASQLNLSDPHDWLLADGEPVADTVGESGQKVDLFLRCPSRLADDPRPAGQLAKLIRILVPDYDLVIVDLPPVDYCRSWLVNCSDFDAAILVQNSSETTSDAVHAAAEGLHAAGLGAVGVVENFQRN